MITKTDLPNVWLMRNSAMRGDAIQALAMDIDAGDAEQYVSARRIQKLADELDQRSDNHFGMMEGADADEFKHHECMHIAMHLAALELKKLIGPETEDK